jgi:hypothetical protein
VVELVAAGLAVLLVAPGFALAARLEPAIPGQPAAGPPPTAARLTSAVLLSVLAIKAIRDVFSRSHRE